MRCKVKNLTIKIENDKTRIIFSKNFVLCNKLMNPLTIGIIGGGQLGRMFIESALRYNVRCNIVDADPNCPAHPVAYKHIIGSLNKASSLYELAAISDVITYEIEHIFIDALIELEKAGTVLMPSSAILQVIQDKGLQKQFYTKNHIPTSPYKIVLSPDEWLDAINGLKDDRFAAKLCRNGYDGKGVALFDKEFIQKHPDKIPFTAPTVIESFIDCQKEISVIVARDRKGNISCFPPVEMEFDPKANLVSILLCPADISPAIRKQANEIAITIAEKFNGVGIFAVEFFLDHNDNLFVNETAPRPHNSGHHTIEACFTSQYEQLLRILLDYPLGSTELIFPAVMINVLGAPDFAGKYYFAGYDKILQIPGVYVHLYNKEESRPNRKLGHITILGRTLEEAKEKATFVQQNFSILKAGN